MEQQSLPAEALPQTATPVSSFKGLFEVFYSPASWFEKLRSDPKVLIPYIVLAIFTAVVFFVAGDLIVKMQMESPQMQEQLQGQPMPDSAAAMMWYSTVIGGTIAMLLAPLLAAALALFWGNVVFAGKASFKSLLSVMLYGELIYAVGNLIVLPLALAKDSLAVGLNLGILAADRGLQDVLYTALSKIDIFIIWEIIVVGIGLAIIYGFPRNKGYKLSVLSMGLLTILGVAVAAIGSMF
ncbi:MAG: YIP1 family protein [candidate division Zixibacteria bacterium]|nr:YIP1 family protein [candidate division Zixibacteria bacterium]